MKNRIKNLVRKVLIVLAVKGLLSPWFREILQCWQTFICDAHHGHMPKLGKKTFDSFDVYRRIIHAGTMPHIDGKLEHAESIHLQTFSKERIFPFVFLGLCWQIKEYEYPHDAIFTKSIHSYEGFGCGVVGYSG